MRIFYKICPSLGVAGVEAAFFLKGSSSVFQPKPYFSNVKVLGLRKLHLCWKITQLWRWGRIAWKDYTIMHRPSQNAKKRFIHGVPTSSVLLYISSLLATKLHTGGIKKNKIYIYMYKFCEGLDPQSLVNAWIEKCVNYFLMLSSAISIPDSGVLVIGPGTVQLFISAWKTYLKYVFYKPTWVPPERMDPIRVPKIF